MFRKKSKEVSDGNTVKVKKILSFDDEEEDQVEFKIDKSKTKSKSTLKRETSPTRSYTSTTLKTVSNSLDLCIQSLPFSLYKNQQKSVKKVSSFIPSEDDILSARKARELKRQGQSMPDYIPINEKVVYLM